MSDVPRMITMAAVGVTTLSFGLSAYCLWQGRRQPSRSLLIEAAHFSAQKHRNQRRKNPEQTPYINHPISVVHHLQQAGIADEDVLAAAMLHDTVEDTDTSLSEVEAIFGSKVASIVAEVSDDKSLPKQERKQLQIEHAASCSREAKLIKMADKFDNLSDLLVVTPIGWEPERVAKYFDWAEKVTNPMRGTNSILEAQLDDVFRLVQIAVDVAAEQLSKGNPGQAQIDDYAA